jgi:hypothetical protein
MVMKLSSGSVFKLRCAMKPMTKSRFLRAISTVCCWYSGVMRWPSELISASRRRERRNGGGPRRMSSVATSRLKAPSPFVFGSGRGDMLSVRIDIDVVTLTTLCFRSGDFMLNRLSSPSISIGDSIADCCRTGSSSSSSSSSPPLHCRVAEISVFTDVLYLAIVASAAFSRAVTMAGPGRTCAFVISDQRAIR